MNLSIVCALAGLLQHQSVQRDSRQFKVITPCHVKPSLADFRLAEMCQIR